MERGFYHADRGYWQTVGEISQEVIDAYPKGTVEVPLKPGADYEYSNSRWLHTPRAPEIDAAREARIAATAAKLEKLGVTVSELREVLR